MSISKECQEYHLTPHGWVEGSFKGDALGKSKDLEIPKERVLTIACYDEIPAEYAEPFFYDEVIWKSKDKQLIAQLKEKFGDKPDWFGYKKMKN